MDPEDKLTSRVLVEAGGLIMRSTAALQLARNRIDQLVAIERLRWGIELHNPDRAGWQGERVRHRDESEEHNRTTSLGSDQLPEREASSTRLDDFWARTAQRDPALEREGTL